MGQLVLDHYLLNGIIELLRKNSKNETRPLQL